MRRALAGHARACRQTRNSTTPFATGLPSGGAHDISSPLAFHRPDVRITVRCRCAAPWRSPISCWSIPMEPAATLDSRHRRAIQVPRIPDRQHALWRFGSGTTASPDRVTRSNEQVNMTGSIKDRMALHIMRQAVPDGADQAGRHDCRGDQWQHGHRLLGHRPRPRPPGHRVSCSELDEATSAWPLISSFGWPRIRAVSREQGGFLGSIRLVRKNWPARNGNVFLPVPVLETRPTPTPTCGRRAGDLVSSSACRGSRRTRSSRAWAPEAP